MFSECSLTFPIFVGESNAEKVGLNGPTDSHLGFLEDLGKVKPIMDPSLIMDSPAHSDVSRIWYTYRYIAQKISSDVTLRGCARHGFIT